VRSNGLDSSSRAGLLKPLFILTLAVTRHPFRTHRFSNDYESGTKPDIIVSSINGLRPQEIQNLVEETDTYPSEMADRNKELKQTEKGAG